MIHYIAHHIDPHAAVVFIVLGLVALATGAIIYGARLDARAWRRACKRTGYGARGERREIR